jgi:alkanesulfonate monooxygenase SsuD/methylene tetrahydromethanopterin reductase-like flavin-dependent oxidoreductase (luciferase family)
VLRLGLFYPNAPSIHVLSGEVARHNPDVRDLATHIEVARAAEEAGFDYLFMADSWGRYGPADADPSGMSSMVIAPILAAALLPVTSHIRLITTIHTSWFHPLQLARMGAALDNLSGGRWGVNIVSGAGFADRLVGADVASLSHQQRYERAAEVVEIATQAWSRGTVDFHGQHFQLVGEVPGPTTRGGARPLIVSAGASPAGCAFAGRYADYVFMPGRTPLEECRARLADIRRVATAAHRDPATVKLQMHASVIVGETAAEAAEAVAWVRERVDLQATADYLQSVRANISTYDDIYREMGELRLREIGMVSGARAAHGDPVAVASELQVLHDDFGCDGVAVTLPRWEPAEIRRFGELVLPELQRRGLWVHPNTRHWTW